MPDFRVEMREIYKYFPVNGITALNGANFNIKSGEIHALLGENGAGKSTLMQILAGFLTQDAGKITINGVEKRFRSTQDAIICRIGMVRQKPELTPGLKIWENCALGVEGVCLLAGYRKSARERVHLLNKQLNFALPIDARTETLSIAQRQFAAVLALLLRGTLFLVFDEPTAMLSLQESVRLFDLWRKIIANGKGVVIISHKLEETLTLADRFTVLRNGKTALTCTAEDCSKQRIIEAMFGEEKPVQVKPRRKMILEDDLETNTVQKDETKCVFDVNCPVIEVKNLSVSETLFPALKNLSFKVKRGEILGIAGFRESGIETLELVLAGFIEHGISGSILLNGVEVTGKGTAVFRKNGGAHFSAGRKKIAAGKFIMPEDPCLSIRDNLLIYAHKRLLTQGFGKILKFFDKNKTDDWLSGVMNDAEINRNGKEKWGTLSGGMGQRLLGIREFAENPSLVLCTEPAWGLDRNRRQRFFHYLRKKAAEGCGIIIFFSDIDEFFIISDKIMVLRNGKCAELLCLNDKNRNSDVEIISKKIKMALVGG
ncbi:MAG: ATP-binding cassette domain-containing protein [Spirochaetaceae bacterium]|jgi:simple sugar transport system ATP-binding protein|nr:ATP-binding cassette domain-containing protein [Spirochaetaceae bacterium]